MFAKSILEVFWVTFYNNHHIFYCVNIVADSSPHFKSGEMNRLIVLNYSKEVLGMWVSGNESAKYWLEVLNEIRNRSINDILIVSNDGISKFADAIRSVFPNAEIQFTLMKNFCYFIKPKITDNTSKISGNIFLT